MNHATLITLLSEFDYEGKEELEETNAKLLSEIEDFFTSVTIPTVLKSCITYPADDNIDIDAWFQGFSLKIEELCSECNTDNSYTKYEIQNNTCFLYKNIYFFV